MIGLVGDEGRGFSGVIYTHFIYILPMMSNPMGDLWEKINDVKIAKMFSYSRTKANMYVICG